MKNFEKKETNLNLLIDKLAKLNTSYSQNSFDNKSIEREKNSFKSEKEELEKKNQEILREHKYLKDRVKKLELNQETQSLVDEIEKWQM